MASFTTFAPLTRTRRGGWTHCLRETFVAWAQQDQISAIFPMAAIVVAPLLESVGLLHPDPTLVVMPDDPRLGEFREEFTGLLGFIEERARRGSRRRARLRRLHPGSSAPSASSSVSRRARTTGSTPRISYGPG